MTSPTAFQAVLLALASWRVWQLLAADDILDRPRNWLCKVDENGRVGRPRLADFLECPYCLGFWVAVAWTVFFAAWPTGATWAAFPLAFNAVVVTVHRWLSDR